MPSEFDYERLMNDRVTQEILNKYVEEGADRLRWNKFSKITNHMKLQRRLDKLCEFGILGKEDGNGNPIKGGREAPESFYVLRGNHWKRAIWTSDMRSLREAHVDKLFFRRNMSLYGMDESDFEGMEREKEQCEHLMALIDFLLGALGGWKMLVVQKKLHKNIEALEKNIDDPIVRWMAERYLWGEVVVPFLMSWEDPGNRFLEYSSELLLKTLDQDEGLNEDERERVRRSIEEGLRLPLTHHDIFQEAIGEAKRFLKGIVVGHVDLRPYPDSGDLSKAEAAFEVLLESGTETFTSMRFFNLLRGYTSRTDKYSVNKSRLSLAMDSAMKWEGRRFLERLLRNQEELDEKFLNTALGTDHFDPPPAPMLDDLRSYWTSEGK